MQALNTLSEVLISIVMGFSGLYIISTDSIVNAYYSFSKAYYCSPSHLKAISFRVIHVRGSASLE